MSPNVTSDILCLLVFDNFLIRLGLNLQPKVLPNTFTFRILKERKFSVDFHCCFSFGDYIDVVMALWKICHLLYDSLSINMVTVMLQN